MVDIDIAELRRIAEAATPGPWAWSPETDGWGDVGPNLETVERGPLYEDGSQGAAEIVVGSWGHDANGITVEPADAAHIATFDPPTVLALIDRLERAEKTIERTREWLNENRPIHCSYGAPEGHDDAGTILRILAGYETTNREVRTSPEETP